MDSRCIYHMPVMQMVGTTAPTRSRVRRSHAERSAETRERVLAATLAVMGASGARGASMLGVAKAAGVTPGAVQHHFGTKAELMAQVVERLVSQQEGTAVRWPSPRLAPARRARAYVDALWTALYAPERFLVAWGIYFDAADDAALRARIGAQRAGVSATMHRRFREVFPEAPTAGLDAFVDLVLSSLRGIGVTRLFDREPRATARQLAALAALIEARCTPAAGAASAKRRSVVRHTTSHRPAMPPPARRTPRSSAS